MTLRPLLGILIVIVVAGAGQGPADAAIGRRLTSRVAPLVGTLSALESAALQSLYGAEARALWTDSSGRPTGSARKLLALLEEAAGDGLNPREYGMPGLRNLAGELERVASAHTMPSDTTADFEVAISAAALRYFGDLHFGRVDPATLGLRVQPPADRHDMSALLRSAISTGRIPETAAELVPELAQYRSLRETLARYRSIADDPTIPPAPSFSGPLRPGDLANSSVLSDLARRLAALGDLAPDIANEPRQRYDGPLTAAVTRFQTRHGLEADGLLGRATHAALSVPVSWRVRQIELSLERLRWLPDLSDVRVIALNIPMFRLWAWDAVRPGGRAAFSTRAIVGRALRTQTPVFVEEMREVIFRPFWNVPRSILLEEILPLVGKDPGYLRREAMEIVQGAGDDAIVVELTEETLARLRQGSLRVRQRPGPGNALGLVKFEFPNDEHVYLHGTPAQALFARTRRDFSHGCVRVEDPVALAEWVLSDRGDWPRERILRSTAGTGTSRVAVARPVQVVLFYVTAAVMPEDGTIHFAEDIYRHDAALDPALGRSR